MDTAKRTQNKIRFPIGFKLVFITTILLLFSLGAITLLASALITQDLRVIAEDNNFTANARSAVEAEHILDAARSRAIMLLYTLNAVSSSAALREESADFFFRENGDIAAVALLEESRPDLLLKNNDFFIKNETGASAASVFLEQQKDRIAENPAGKITLLNAAPVFEIPVLAMVFPVEQGGRKQAVVFFSSDSLVEAFGTGVNVSFMINDAGDVLVHTDHSLVRTGANLGGAAIVRSIADSGEMSRQTLYTDEDGTTYFGAVTRLEKTGALVITNAEYRVVFEGIAATTRRNILLTVGVLCISMLFIWFFSKTISLPLKNLAAASERIRGGQFDIELAVKGRDEIGFLTERFMEMGKGLAERERLKNTFGKFINKAIADLAMKGELTLGGENKRVSIFFSDIRNFTAISEKLEPARVVEFLNEYMTLMVKCIDKTGGTVDKFIGDAVMAVWGAPISRRNDAREALSCVHSAIFMRESLLEFNKDRGGDEKPIIKIGCGINTGDVIAGQIGSNERMEYTVIGDTVNLASRVESLNKPLGTDILITENTWRLIKDHIIAEEMPAVTVKGKEKPVRIFAVINIRPDKPGDTQPHPVNLAELRDILGIDAPDLEKVDINAEEKKYKFHSS